MLNNNSNYNDDNRDCLKSCGVAYLYFITKIDFDHSLTQTANLSKVRFLMFRIMF